MWITQRCFTSRTRAENGIMKERVLEKKLKRGLNSDKKDQAFDPTGPREQAAGQDHNQYPSPAVGGSVVALGAGTGVAECEERG